MFDLWGITFHWYGLLIGLSIWVAMEVSLTYKGDLKKDLLEKAMIWSVVGGIIGARVYHVIDYWSRYYSTGWVKIFYFWEGGLGIWGALGGGVLGLIFFCYFNKLKILKFVDVIILGMPLAQAIGRVGNYINGEIVGKNGEPLFAFEGILNIILFGILMILSRNKTRKTGLIFGIYLVGYGVIRAVLENLRPTETIWRIMNIPTAIIFSVFSISLGIYFIFQKKQS